MTKKDYIIIAKALNYGFEMTEGHDGFSRCIHAILTPLIPMLKADNPRFNEDRFMEAVFKK